eukprot:scaffold1046_cov162-Ochromonas_danica.AAC.44
MGEKENANNQDKATLPGQDCLECRLVGGITLTGLSIYSNHLRMISSARSHKMFYGAFAIGTAALAAYRLFGP